MKPIAVRKLAASLAILAIAGLTSTAVAGPQVPIKGEFVTEFKITKLEFPLPPPYDGVPVVTLEVKGAGQASHLGRTVCLSTDETVDFTQGGKLTGTLTLTAANGDELIADMNAVAVVDQNGVVTFDGTLTFTGGTGRFATATGTASFEGGAAPASGPTGVGWFSFRGTVSSPGASKK